MRDPVLFRSMVMSQWNPILSNDTLFLPAFYRLARLPVVYVCLIYFLEQTKSYIVEAALIPFLLKSCSDTANPCEIHPGVMKMLDLMWACMENFEILPCLKHLFYGLLKSYWHRPVLADFKTQVRQISLYTMCV